MTARHRQDPRPVGPELEALLAAGDHREATRRARRVLEDGGARDGDRAAARAALARIVPERGAVIVAASALAFLVAVALLGLAAR